ncbi:MAG: tetratricopeptide repeat protein [Polyangiaceae bacterium]
MRRTGRTKTGSAEEAALWKRAAKAENSGLFALSLELTRMYVHAYPDNVWGWAVLGLRFGGLTRLVEARGALAIALRMAPRSVRGRLYWIVASFYDEISDLERAMFWLRRLVAICPDTPSWILKGCVHARLGEHAEAKRCHKNAIEANDGDVDEAYYNLGLLLRAEGDYTRARRCLEKALELDPHYGVAERALRDVAAAVELRLERGPTD